MSVPRFGESEVRRLGIAAGTVKYKWAGGTLRGVKEEKKGVEDFKRKPSISRRPGQLGHKSLWTLKGRSPAKGSLGAMGRSGDGGVCQQKPQVLAG